MCKRFEKSKSKFVGLVHEMRHFTEDQIVSAFKLRNNNDLIIDEHATVKEVLISLKEIGTLRYDGTFYTVVPKNQRESFDRFALHVFA